MENINSVVTSGALKTIVSQVKTYIDSKDAANLSAAEARIAAIVGSAPEALDTLEEIAARLAEDSTAMDAIRGILSGKQETIADLETIRSGAAAGATAYQKADTGIPEDDLAQAVKDKLNATVATISTADTNEIKDLFNVAA